MTHVNVWQKPLPYCKIISLQLIKINEKKILAKVSGKTQTKPTGFPLPTKLTFFFWFVFWGFLYSCPVWLVES